RSLRWGGVGGRRGGGRGGVRGAGRLPGTARLVPGAEGALGRGRSRHAPRLPAARGRERSSSPPGAGAQRFPVSSCGRSKGTMRHRAKVVEYRVDQHKKVLKEPAAALRLGA